MTDAADTHDAEPLDGDDAPEKTALQETVEIVKTVVYALLIALVLRIFLFQPFTIPSASMKPNLQVGDYVVTTKFTYGYSKHSIPFAPPLFKGRILAGQPKPGDIIVFNVPYSHKDLIKRLVGLPGDRVRVQDGVVFVNGKPLQRVYEGQGAVGACPNPEAIPRIYRETNAIGRSYVTYDCGVGPLDTTEEVLVPEGHYFMMGDNRDNSLDSRVIAEAGGAGLVPAENLVGKAQIILLSWDEEASLFKPWTWFLNARYGRFFHGLY